MDKNNELCDRYFENLMSLSEAIQDAGGDVSVLEGKMTLNKLLYICATNNIEITAKFNRPDTKRHEVYCTGIDTSHVAYSNVRPKTAYD